MGVPSNKPSVSRCLSTLTAVTKHSKEEIESEFLSFYLCSPKLIGNFSSAGNENNHIHTRYSSNNKAAMKVTTLIFRLVMPVHRHGRRALCDTAATPAVVVVCCTTPVISDLQSRCLRSANCFSTDNNAVPHQKKNIPTHLSFQMFRHSPKLVLHIRLELMVYFYELCCHLAIISNIKYDDKIKSSRFENRLDSGGYKL